MEIPHNHHHHHQIISKDEFSLKAFFFLSFIVYNQQTGDFISGVTVLVLGRGNTFSQLGH
jgi:hypothetical protein